jgi:nitrilase
MKVAVEAIEELAADGAGLVVFPETFIPGYPAWIWNLRPGEDYRATARIHRELVANSIDLTADDLAPVCEAAGRAGVVVMCGIHEREGSYSRATLYNTLVTVGPDGTILNRHRKLVPTNPERMVWGPGDASGLRVVDAPFGRLGGLICWENYMPLARFSLYAQGVEVYVAPTWDEGDAWISSMRHIAAEGGCWVLGAGCAIRTDDVPASFPDGDSVFAGEEEWLNPGDSVIVAPGGQLVAGPLHQEYGVLTAQIDVGRATERRRVLDVAGHYGRPDVFRLTVDRSERVPIRFDAPS